MDKNRNGLKIVGKKGNTPLITVEVECETRDLTHGNIVPFLVFVRDATPGVTRIEMDILRFKSKV